MCSEEIATSHNRIWQSTYGRSTIEQDSHTVKSLGTRLQLSDWNSMEALIMVSNLFSSYLPRRMILNLPCCERSTTVEAILLSPSTSASFGPPSILPPSSTRSSCGHKSWNSWKSNKDSKVSITSEKPWTCWKAAICWESCHMLWESYAGCYVLWDSYTGHHTLWNCNAGYQRPQLTSTATVFPASLTLALVRARGWPHLAASCLAMGWSGTLIPTRAVPGFSWALSWLDLSNTVVTGPGRRSRRRSKVTVRWAHLWSVIKFPEPIPAWPFSIVSGNKNQLKYYPFSGVVNMYGVKEPGTRCFCACSVSVSC